MLFSKRIKTVKTLEEELELYQLSIKLLASKSAIFTKVKNFN